MRQRLPPWPPSSFTLKHPFCMVSQPAEADTPLFTGAKFLFGGRGGGSASWVAYKWTWCLSGCTWLARTAILQDPVFIHALTTETWAGRTLNAGSDNFITRYLLQNDHIIALQNTEAATVWRTAKASSIMLNQRLR